jgi:hypothetical protein
MSGFSRSSGDEQIGPGPAEAGHYELPKRCDQDELKHAGDNNTGNGREEETRGPAGANQAKVGPNRDDGFHTPAAGHVCRLGQRDRKDDGAQGCVAAWDRIWDPDDSVLPQSRW